MLRGSVIRRKWKWIGMLVRHPKIDAVYAHNDRIAPGAYQAAKKVGREKK